MDEEKKIHCLHICGHIEAKMEEVAAKQFEEKMQARKPIQCSTAEDSEQLHEIYKDRVSGTKPSEEKAKMIEEMMAAIEHAKFVHSMTLLRAKQEEAGLKRHPSTLSHMHHDDSDSEGEIEEFAHQDVEDSTNETPGTEGDDATTIDNDKDNDAGNQRFDAQDAFDTTHGDNNAMSCKDLEIQEAVDDQLETDAETNTAAPTTENLLSDETEANQ